MKSRKCGYARGVASSINAIVGMLLCIIPRAVGQIIHELVTTYEGGWIQDGVMFDVNAVRTPLDLSGAVDIATSTPDGITVFGLDILTPLREGVCVELYTKAGSFNDAAFDPEKWTFLGSFNLMGMGPSAPTSIPLGSFEPVTIGLDQTQAFYITTQNESLRYTALDPDEFMTGDVYVSGQSEYNFGSTATNRDGNRQLQTSDGMVVEILTGVAKNYPFAESWPHRVFNGALLYTTGKDSSLSFLSDAQLDTAQAVKRGSVTCDVDAVSITPPPTPPPTNVVVPTGKPSDVPTPTPSDAPTLKPTPSPTTLQSTIKKVATTLAGGLKQAGMMFDIVVPSVAEGGPSEGITILSLEMSTFLTDAVCVEVYSKSGTHVGFERDDVILNADGTGASNTWDVLGAATITGNGESGPTYIPIGALDPVFVAAGERRAFYITLTVPEMRYTEPRFGERVGDVFAASPDGHVNILIGSALSYPFADTWADRIYNGALVYALGDIGDSKYNEMSSESRSRRCIAPEELNVGSSSSPSKIPTSAPIKSDTEVGGDAETKASATPTSAPVKSETLIGGDAETEAAAATPTDIETEETATTSNEEDTTDVDDATGVTSNQDYQAAGYTGRLADLCPESDTGLVTMNIVVPYEYTFISDRGTVAGAIITEVEDELHSSLIADKCPAIVEKMRLLQEVVKYKGFNSNPADQLSQEGCGQEVPLDEGKECHIVSGGVTAVIGTDDDIAAVMIDMESYVKSFFSNPAFAESLGVQSILYQAPKYDNTTFDEDLAIEDDLAIDAVNGEIQDAAAVGSNAKQSKLLSNTGIITLSVLACALVTALVALYAKRVRKERGVNRARANSLELFHEFPDEEDRITFSKYGVHASSSAGFDENLAPISSKGKYRRSPIPPPPPLPKKLSSYSQAVVIVNEVDNASLFSEERNRYGIEISDLRTRTHSDTSSGSLDSRGSRGSKKSVEFIRAGQTFTSSPAGIPEDTVDL
jgi:hypothetical protein